MKYKFQDWRAQPTVISDPKCHSTSKSKETTRTYGFISDILWSTPVRSSLDPFLNRTFDSVSLWYTLYAFSLFIFGAEFDCEFQS